MKRVIIVVIDKGNFKTSFFNVPSNSLFAAARHLLMTEYGIEVCSINMKDLEIEVELQLDLYIQCEFLTDIKKVN